MGTKEKAAAEEIKTCKANVKVADDKVANLTEELKRSQEELAKAVAAKEKFKEVVETNYKEATKLQEDLEASMKEATYMDSENVFDIYSAPEAPAAPPSRKKTSKRHPGESSKAPQAKKPRNAGLPEDGPSANATPPSPHEQQTPPAPARSTPSPAAPTDQTQQASPASTGGDITSRAFRSEMLTLTASRLRPSAVIEQAKSLEQRHADELKAAEAKYVEQLAAVLEEKNKLAKELREKKKSLDKATE
ncbi:uncharacterized protein LOC133832046 [Humulus lupulus]|uniref:uncharacterized protein LOC133832046 n=1 Tax=Humulus lupulus TaxID=3486 RepID=UPI002B40A03B|nr:uncharacterized protein LOC133832046 [Humulus lupulus]